MVVEFLFSDWFNECFKAIYQEKMELGIDSWQFPYEVIHFIYSWQPALELWKKAPDVIKFSKESMGSSLIRLLK